MLETISKCTVGRPDLTKFYPYDFSGKYKIKKDYMLVADSDVFNVEKKEVDELICLDPNIVKKNTFKRLSTFYGDWESLNKKISSANLTKTP